MLSPLLPFPERLNIGAMQPEAIGYVTRVRCRQCGEDFPVFSLSADTDMVIQGLVSLTRTDNRNIAIAMAGPGESLEDVQNRMSPPYRASRLSFSKHPLESGVPFQEFRKHYRPPNVSYSCIFCDGEADPFATESVSEFELHSRIEMLS